MTEGIDLKECNEMSRKCSLCKFYYFLNKNFNYHTYLCDGCHDVSIKATSMQNLVIIYHGRNAYRINFVFMSKNDAFKFNKKFKYNRPKGSVIMPFNPNNLDRINASA